MARRKKKEELPFGFNEGQADIATLKQAIRWLRAPGDVDGSDANWFSREFPGDFVLDCRHFATSKSRDLLGFSNLRSWKREYESSEGKLWWWLVGDDCILALTKDADGNTTSEADALEELDGYPVFDDSDHSDLEQEQQWEDWKDYGRSNLRSEIISKADDEELVEKLMGSVTDEMLDDFRWEAEQASGEYPEMENDSTHFPNYVSDWDGDIYSLGEMLQLEKAGFIAEVSLSTAAFDDSGKIILRRQDLPEAVVGLIDNPTPIKIQKDYSFCNNPYLVCSWTGETALKQREEDARQQRLPGINEAREAANETKKRYAIAPVSAPAWLVKQRQGEGLIEIDISTVPENWAQAGMRWDLFVESLDSSRDAKFWYESAADQHGLNGYVAGQGLIEIAVLHKGSPVWWTSLDDGPIEVATLYDIVELGKYPQPWTMHAEGDEKRAWGKEMSVWLMSLDQWDNAEYPAESLGGPPYIKGVSVARERKRA